MLNFSKGSILSCIKHLEFFLFYYDNFCSSQMCRLIIMPNPSKMILRRKHYVLMVIVKLELLDVWLLIVMVI